MADQKVHLTNFKVIETQRGDRMSAAYVSCGPEHCLMTESASTIPYSWGSNEKGQLGINKEMPSKSRKKAKNQTKDSLLYREYPHRISTFSSLIEGRNNNQIQMQTLLKNSPKQIKRKEEGEKQVNDQTNTTYRFPI